MEHDIPEERKIQLRRARITAMILGSSVVMVLLFFMYALVQKSEAGKFRSAASDLQKQLEITTQLVEEQKRTIDNTNALLEESLRAPGSTRAQLEQKLKSK